MNNYLKEQFELLNIYGHLLSEAILNKNYKKARLYHKLYRLCKSNIINDIYIPPFSVN